MSSAFWQGGRLMLAFFGMAALAAATHADDRGQAERRTVETPEVRVCYREVPWSPKRAGQPDPASVGPANPWTVATMDVRERLAIGQEDLETGCYAWVCIVDEDGKPVLELRRLQLPEGTLPDPEDLQPLGGRSVFRMPLEFDTARGTTPHLTIELLPGKGGLRLRTRYGDGEAETTLRKR